MRFIPSLVAIATLAGVNAATHPLVQREETPMYHYDPSTTEYCTWWYDNTDGSIPCEQIPAANYITQAEWERWNPIIAKGCSNFHRNQSYCVEAQNEPSSVIPTTTPAPTTSTHTTTTSTATTTTKPPNGITTPTPTQPGMVDNCNRFHFVKSGESCQQIAGDSGISIDQFLQFNPLVGGSSCSGLWAEAYVCIGIIGMKPSPTHEDNGVQTPAPTQANMIDVCGKFYMVKSGQGCIDVAHDNGITLADLQSWNRGLGSDCATLLASTYACVAPIELYDFDKGNMAGWTVVNASGKFSAEDKKLHAAQANGGMAVVHAAFGDVYLSADVQLSSDQGSACLILRSSHSSGGKDGSGVYQGYYAGIGAGGGGGYVDFGRMGTTLESLKRVKFDIKPNTVYRIFVRAVGDSFTVALNLPGRKVVEVQDGSFPRGINGVRVDGTSADFDNVRMMLL